MKAQRQYEIALAYQQATDARRGERDGVVVTPPEVVDWQVRAVFDRLEAQGVPLLDPRVRFCDPFTGTGIYLARILQLAPLTPAQKIVLAGRMRGLEYDLQATKIARENLATVMGEETGQTAVRPQVICVDTFTLLPGEEWELVETDSRQYGSDREVAAS